MGRAAIGCHTRALLCSITLVILLGLVNGRMSPGQARVGTASTDDGPFLGCCSSCRACRAIALQLHAYHMYPSPIHVAEPSYGCVVSECARPASAACSCESHRCFVETRPPATDLLGHQACYRHQNCHADAAAALLLCEIRLTSALAHPALR